MFRRIRIAILSLILVIAALSTITDRIYSTRWTAPLVVALYPIDADRSATAERYIQTLTLADFQPLEEFFQTESAHYGIKIDSPVQFTLAPPLNSIPPTPPADRNPLRVIFWSLHLRWWAWRAPPKPPGPTPRIRMFLLYHDPARVSVLEDSTGLTKGLIGIAQLFATPRMHGSNLVVVAHELSHTLGATDKYSFADNLPIYPDGYGEPDLQPRYPQRYAELMAGRIAISPSSARIPESLDDVVIGTATAKEIGWLH